jgi:hypothetical protein
MPFLCVHGHFLLSDGSDNSTAAYPGLAVNLAKDCAKDLIIEQSCCAGIACARKKEYDPTSNQSDRGF